MYNTRQSTWQKQDRACSPVLGPSLGTRVSPAVGMPIKPSALTGHGQSDLSSRVLANKSGDLSASPGWSVAAKDFNLFSLPESFWITPMWLVQAAVPDLKDREGSVGIMVWLNSPRSALLHSNAVQKPSRLVCCGYYTKKSSLTSPPTETEH